MCVREKLVEQAISYFWYGVSHDIFSEPVTTYAKLAIEALKKENGATLQEWISVDDRLPEFCVSVLARCFYHGKWRTLVCHTSKENAGEWYTDEVCQWVKVTHWMPLPPELPKGE